MAQPHKPPRPGKGRCAGYAHRSRGNFRLRSRLHAKELRVEKEGGRGTPPMPPSKGPAAAFAAAVLRSSSPSLKLPRTLLGLKHRRRRGCSAPRVPSPGWRQGRAGLENLQFRLQLRLSQPRILASSRGRRSERRDSPSFSPL
ncbi:hypothetical protein CgunFtcFv8_019842 [Champsocephalus gunnari]|uniref:Uncharacterized protein n=1 Tax=Champsocephalus gunnari TaxID=52237 RepID=A0AAN8HNI7_CHAGU|nr:hypothetical protein CgunFtcFv8_019842 [Champsocephalus gunnari]